VSEPIFFISHFRIREGKFDALQRLSVETTERLRVEKPRTILFLSYVDEDRAVISFLHAFADADAMDSHFEGADERSRAALEFIEPTAGSSTASRTPGRSRRCDGRPPRPVPRSPSSPITSPASCV
jgi:hypothetical protein